MNRMRLGTVFVHFMMCALFRTWGSSFGDGYAFNGRLAAQRTEAASLCRDLCVLGENDIQGEDAKAFLTRVRGVFEDGKTSIFIDHKLFHPFLSYDSQKSVHDLFYKTVGDAFDAHPNIARLHLNVILDRDNLSCLLEGLLRKNHLQHLALCTDQTLSSDVLKDAFGTCQSLRSVALENARQDFGTLPLLLSAPHVNTLIMRGDVFSPMYFTDFLQETLRARPVRTLYLGHMMFDVRAIRPFFSFLKDDTRLTGLFMVSIYLKGVPLDEMGKILAQGKALTQVKLAGIYERSTADGSSLYLNISHAASCLCKPLTYALPDQKSDFPPFQILSAEDDRV